MKKNAGLSSSRPPRSPSPAAKATWKASTLLSAHPDGTVFASLWRKREDDGDRRRGGGGEETSGTAKAAAATRKRGGSDSLSPLRPPSPAQDLRFRRLLRRVIFRPLMGRRRTRRRSRGRSSRRAARSCSAPLASLASCASRSPSALVQRTMHSHRSGRHVAFRGTFVSGFDSVDPDRLAAPGRGPPQGYPAPEACRRRGCRRGRLPASGAASLGFDHVFAVPLYPGGGV